ncbi:hypothetical protein BD309DRAFT_991228 [Dichomitus squalens]|uniref:Uncharacterized protein n=2 Tax=Dichomitus squalens TaxID=114155 RepID=A0A4Q9NT67_9APHY|nr:uncharacterized protein DICSQDRAFT_156576 [Dichomitus squalens LYAD-421 SS1]EJF58792.1 hypothetical protein DICSQDRAFT_156576 [Dichomitus squalens LYAD-421 SS1]TBU43131.1 hypothetical protein BD309DRAFT_991228 [Dichomitus squalens]TBU53994.1 hypothetical protein BD310DRAFT_110389 [Dichomitus squalens]
MRPCSGYYRSRDTKIRRRWDDPAPRRYKESSHTSSTPRCPPGPRVPPPSVLESTSTSEHPCCQRRRADRLRFFVSANALPSSIRFGRRRRLGFADTGHRALPFSHRASFPSLEPAKVAMHSLEHLPPSSPWVARATRGKAGTQSFMCGRAAEAVHCFGRLEAPPRDPRIQVGESRVRICG